MTEAWTAGPLSRAGSADLAGSNGRVIRYVLSDSSVARDGHTIATGGWNLERYLKNPVVLWAHDAGMPPIGRMVEIGTIGDRLMGSVEYPAPDEYDFADTIYKLVRGGYLNAVSVGWIPLDWEYSKDRGRPGGIDFKRAELIEVSQVPVPALPTALVAARAAGIDTGPLYQWAEKVLDQGDTVLVPREQLEAMRRAAKMPTPSDAAAIAQRKREFRERLVRDLCDCGWLAMIIDQLACLEDCIAYDAEYEGEDSPIATRLMAVLRTLGQILVDMTVEEVGELLGPEPPEEEPGTPAQRAIRGIGTALAAAKTPEAPPVPTEVPVVQIGTEAARIVAEALQRAGRVLSAENEATLRQALDMHSNASDMIRSVIERGMPAEPPSPVMDDTERSLAEAKAKVARLRQAAA